MVVGVVNAQRPEGNNKKAGAKVAQGEVFGQVKDSKSNEVLEYAAVSLYTVSDDKLITGSITNGQGKFTINEVPFGKYYLIISFVGYEPKRVEGIVVSEKDFIINLKTIEVTSDNELEEIVLDGSTPTIRYDIDKKIVDVSKLEVDLGQSAVEILENTPSINVDNEGNVSLRGSSSFTLLINGRPTAMDASEALATIPANTIKNIEIITNPSAKYESEGVSGIINIVTKTNRLEGMSFLTNLTGGNYDNYAGDFSLNMREKKTELNIGIDFRNRTRPSDQYNERISRFDNSTSTVISNGLRDWQAKNYGINGEFTYTPNSGHSISIGGRYNRRVMRGLNELFFQEYTNDVNVYSYYNVGDNKYDITSSSTYLNYKYNIGREKDHYLDFRAVYNHRYGDDEVYADFLDADGNKTGGTFNTEQGPSDMLRFNLDYSKKFASEITVEAGSQIQFGKSNDRNRNYHYNPLTEEYELDSMFSSDAYYLRDIYGFYGLVKGNRGDLGFQFGLRTEYTDRTITASTTELETNINRWDWFPTIHLSYQLPKNHQLLINYSRRIQRPRSWYLEPFLTWRDQYTVYSGNPDLQPEYIDAFEVNWIKELSKKGTISVESYVRYVKNYISRVQIPYDTNMLLTTPLNVGETYSIGAEPSFSYKLKKWWKVDIAFNLFSYTINSAHEQLQSSQNFNWNSRLTNTFPLSNTWNIQLATRYVGPANTVQGTQEGYFTANGSIRKSFDKNKYAIVFQVRDIFSTMRTETYSLAGNVESYMLSEPRTPTFTFTFSMRLNNYRKKQQVEEMDDF